MTSKEDTGLSSIRDLCSNVLNREETTKLSGTNFGRNFTIRATSARFHTLLYRISSEFIARGI